MSDGFFEFSEDDTAAGFRLARMELYNWGTFDNRVWIMPLGGKNGLLTGDIGSGKSTVVDAVTTLLVPSHRVSYNKAAGADHRERTLRSYVLGYYKSERSDGGYAAKPVPLRKEGETHSVILGVFHNEGYNQTVTLAQVFRQKEPHGQPDRFFVVADDDMSIMGDFSDFGVELGLLKKRLKKRDRTEVHDRFPSYGAAFCRRFGIGSEQALELFHQTVSLKAVGNLTSFVREHMLEPFDGEKAIENLIHHFDDLNNSHEAVLKAKRQIELLTPLAENLDRHDETSREIDRLEGCREGLGCFFAGIKSGLLKTRIEESRVREESLSLKLGRVREALAEYRRDRDQLVGDIAASGGDRLETLRRDEERLEKQKEDCLRRAAVYDELAGSLELSLLKNPESFSANRGRLAELGGEISRDREELSNEKTDLSVDFKTLNKTRFQLESEIESLKKRKSNIDRRQIEIRERLCRDLSIPLADLSFAGELIAVREEENAWEGAIERVLHSFGLSLLVPEKHYKNVVKWVDETRLKGRLVYYRVGEYKRSPLKIYDKGALMGKIAVKKESPHRDWLHEQLAKRFDYTCCETLGDFRRSARALTKAGQIKGGAIRHEKDDRHDIHDRSRFILGWTNRAKIAALEVRRDEIRETLGDLAEKISRAEQALNEREKRGQLIARLEDFNSYEDLDWKSVSLHLDRVREEAASLRAASDELNALKERLERLDGEIGEAEAERERYQGALAKVTGDLERFGESLSAEEELLLSPPRPMEEIMADLTPLKESILGDRKLFYQNCGKAESDMRGQIQADIDKNKKRRERLLGGIITAMGNFRRDYPGETRDMDVSVEGGREYRELLDRLVRESLPRFEEQFKTRLNENTIREIAGFQGKLSQECQTIEERIERINRSMKGIEYNKDRYIILEVQSANDAEIREFRQELKACIEGSLGGSGGLYTEDKFLQVKSIISRFKGREGRTDIDARWTAKVTDVRNWYVFAASERWQADDTEYEHYTDSGGKSGGQKEKLAYTVLAASLAYQFGLEWGEVRSRSFRFVAIDEAFGRGSDESSRYGLELFKKLNLQLLIITPLQKIHIIEPYVSTVGFVSNEEGKNSLLRCLTIEEYRSEKEKRTP